MTDEAMTAVRRVEAYLAYRQASEDDGCVDVLSEADLTYGDLRTLLTLARQSVGVEEMRCHSCGKPVSGCCETCKRDWQS